jgi:predicted aspartyl protease
MSYQLEFQYLIEYDNGKDGIFLDVEIKYSDQSIKINAKIDNGATYSIFERRFGKELGLQIEKGMRQRFGTATGGFYAYGFRVTLTTAEIELDSMVFFAEDDFFNRNVLGRISWLDNLIVGINDQNGRLYLSKYES